MTARKTIDVDQVRDWVNTRLASPRSVLLLNAPGKDREMTPDEAYRLGIASLLEQILHATGNYQGFGYQQGQVTRYATEPGERPEITDETRRVYY
jgi:hypothetical protein